MPIITYLTHIRFGDGTLSELPEDLAALGIRRPLVVTDKGIVAAGLVERLFDVVSADNRRLVFDDVPTNPTEEAALQAVKLYRDEDCDGLIALGGGSAIDLAKAVGAARDPSGAAGAICDGRRRRRADHAEGRAARRHPDHGRDRQRGRPRLRS